MKDSVGNFIQTEGFLSTSLNRETAEGFGKHILKIVLWMTLVLQVQVTDDSTNLQV